MPRQRFDNLDPEKQAKILEAAFVEFSENGYDGASLNRIIEKTSLSRGVLYYYFDGKADLFVAVVKRAVDSFTQAIAIPDARTPEEFWRQMEISVEQLADTAMLDSRAVSVMKLVSMIWNQDVPICAMRELTSMWDGRFEQLARVGQEAGAIRSDLPFSMLMAAAMGLRQGMDRWVMENWESMTEGERRAFPMKAFSLARRIMEPQA